MHASSSPRVAELGLGALFAALCLGLTLVGGIAWHRTRDLRHGRGCRAERAAGLTSTSPVTLVPALAGVVAVAACSVIAAARRASPLVLALASGGAFVALSGLAGRVTELELSRGGLSIRYAGRKAFAATWREVLALRSPRTPLAGWRIETARGRRTLMPSDIFGNEALLRSLVAWAELEFEGRGNWRRTGLRER